MMNLIETFEAVARGRGNSLTEAVNELNAECATAYTVNDLGKWRRGVKPIPRPVADAMLRRCVPRAVEAQAGALGLSDDGWALVVAALMQPVRR
jgi:hypothetical protein